MILYPAIDIKDGNCVRLLRGNMNKETVFNNKPESQADTFEKLGCEWLHLVDLNGALDGLPINYQTVRKILKRSSVPVQEGYRTLIKQQQQQQQRNNSTTNK